MAFFPKAQAPGGSFIALADATDTPRGVATTNANTATFTTGMIRVVIPHAKA